jgi:hypothetical protein
LRASIILDGFNKTLPYLRPAFWGRKLYYFPLV